MNKHEKFELIQRIYVNSKNQINKYNAFYPKYIIKSKHRREVNKSNTGLTIIKVIKHIFNK